MRAFIIPALLASATFAAAQTSPTTPAPTLPAAASPVFAPAERDAVIAFWSLPDRYTVTVPDNAMDKGLWQVRLTPEGSTWLWNYNKARKLTPPPTADAQPVNDEQKSWETWVAARIAHDRWEALQIAVQSNQRVLGKLVPLPDAATPAMEPPQPGSIPPGLLALVGNPPRFAKAVVPMQHQIRFDDDTIVYQDNFRVGNQRYPYFRYAQGVASEGTPVKSMPADRLDHLFHLAGISDSEARVMRSVSMLEGGFDSINTYDTGFVSVGFIQFACLREGGGSLGSMLASYRASDPDQYQKDFRAFGIDVTPSGALAVIDPTTGSELYGPEAAQRIIDDKRLIAVFQHAGHKSDPYVAAQIRAAKQMFYPADDAVSVTVDGQTLTGTVGDVIKSEAGMATLMDRKVNTGNLGQFAAILNQMAAQVKPKSLADLAKFEFDIVGQMRYRKDYLADAGLSQPSGDARSFSRASRGGSRGGGN